MRCRQRIQRNCHWHVGLARPDVDGGLATHHGAVERQPSTLTLLVSTFLQSFIWPLAPSSGTSNLTSISHQPNVTQTSTLPSAISHIHAAGVSHGATPTPSSTRSTLLVNFNAYGRADFYIRSRQTLSVEYWLPRHLVIRDQSILLPKTSYLREMLLPCHPSDRPSRHTSREPRHVLENGCT